MPNWASAWLIAWCRLAHCKVASIGFTSTSKYRANTTQTLPNACSSITIASTTVTIALWLPWPYWQMTATHGNPKALVMNYLAAAITLSFQASNWCITPTSLTICSSNPTHSLWLPLHTCKIAAPKATTTSATMQNCAWPSCFTSATGTSNAYSTSTQ